MQKALDFKWKSRRSDRVCACRGVGLPIIGDDIIVMNCIWVLRKAKEHGFGRRFLEDMMKSERDAVGFATIALENHWSSWFEKWQMEKLSFKSIDSINVTHKTKHKEQIFSIHLMRMPTTEKTKLPEWDRRKILEGATFCLAIRFIILKLGKGICWKPNKLYIKL